MAKEAKLGVALIAVLLGAFGVALYSRLKQAKSAAAVAAAEEPGPAAKEPEKPKLSSGPLKPTTVPQASGNQSSGDFASAPTSSGNSPAADSNSRYGNYRDSGNPNSPMTGGAAREPFSASSAVVPNSTAASAAVSDSASTNSVASDASDTATRATDRYNDRYGSASRQIYGASSDSNPASASTTDAAEPGTPSKRSDPFNRYGSATTSGNTLTPTADASAALLPASAAVESSAKESAANTTSPSAIGQPAEAAPTENTSSAAQNPLRPVEKPAASSYSSGPRYDIYGSGAESSEAAKIEPAAKAEPASVAQPATNAEPAAVAEPAATQPATSRVRFGPSSVGGSRYSDPTPTTVEQTAAEERAPVAPLAESNPTSRYSTPTTAAGGLAADSGTSQPSRATGWSATTSRSIPSYSAASQPASATGATTSSPAPRPLPAAAIQRGDSYIVEPNDSFSTISKKVYGVDAYFKALHEHNKARYPRADLLRTGDVVATPSAAVLREKYPGLCPKASHVVLPAQNSTFTSQRGGGRVYVVEEGDTLFDIARFELGKATRWAEIYELNKQAIGQDFNHLRPGMQLMLPADVRDDNFTRRPGIGLPR